MCSKIFILAEASQVVHFLENFMRSRYRYHCLAWLNGIIFLCLVSACSTKSNTDYEKKLNQIDFAHPVELEFQLNSKKAMDATKLCKIESKHVFECKIKASFSSKEGERGETSMKTTGIFSREELEDLITFMRKKFQAEAGFSYSFGQQIGSNKWKVKYP